MDMQGTPIGSTNQGMKVQHSCSIYPLRLCSRLFRVYVHLPLADHMQNTTDPAAQNPSSESSGPLASDSLAAESVRSGGSYASNPNSTPSGTPGSKSTLNTTDTSAATTLEPTPDAAEREARNAWGEAADLRGPSGLKYAEGVGGQPDFPGSTNPSGYSGGVSGGGSGAGATGGSGSGSGSSYSGGTSGSDNTGSGADYGSTTGGVPRDITTGTQSVGGSGGLAPGEGKPKGKNLTEGGFEGEAANNDFEIGSDKDPGRAAVQSFQNQNQAIGGGAGPRQEELNTQGGYDALGDEQA